MLRCSVTGLFIIKRNMLTSDVHFMNAIIHRLESGSHSPLCGPHDYIKHVCYSLVRDAGWEETGALYGANMAGRIDSYSC